MESSQSHSHINPLHYKNKIKGVDVQVVDIIEAFVPQDAHLAQAVKYILRAGKKSGSSYLQDVSKGMWWCAKAILFHGGQIELPDTTTSAPIKTTQKPSRKKRA